MPVRDAELRPSHHRGTVHLAVHLVDAVEPAERAPDDDGRAVLDALREAQHVLRPVVPAVAGAVGVCGAVERAVGEAELVERADVPAVRRALGFRDAVDVVGAVVGAVRAPERVGDAVDLPHDIRQAHRLDGAVVVSDAQRVAGSHVDPERVSVEVVESVGAAFVSAVDVSQYVAAPVEHAFNAAQHRALRNGDT